MPSSLTDANISDTYVGVLHANGQQLPYNTRVRIYDGYGNASALSTGLSGLGISVDGNSVFQSLSSDVAAHNTVIASASVTAPNTPSAWALIQSNGTITSQYNVTQVVRNSTGDYTVYFTTAMATANYGINITVTHDNTSNKMICSYVKAVPAQSVSSFSFRTDFLNTGTTAARFDPTSINITVNHI